MSYSPLNSSVFSNAFSGAMAAIVMGGRYINSPTSTTYDVAAAAAGQWAQTFDTTWGANAANNVVLEMVRDASYAAFDGRNSTNASANFQVEVTAVIASITSALAYYTAQGITPPIATPAVVTFAPGGTSSPGVYTTWASLFATVSAVAGPLTIEFDGSLAPTPNVCVIPAGTYAFASNYLKFHSKLAPVQQVSCVTGVTINTLKELSGAVWLRNDGTTTPVTYTGATSAQFGLTLREDASLLCTSTAPCVLFASAGSDFLFTRLYDEAFIQAPSGGAVATLQITGTGSLSLNCGGIQSPTVPTIATNSIGAPTAAQINLRKSAGAVFKLGQTGILDTSALPTPLSFYGDITNGVCGPKGANLTDAPTTLTTAGGRWYVLPAATLTATRAYTLGITGALDGDQITITRLDVTANTATFVDGGSGTPTILTMPVLKINSAVFQFNAGHWALRTVGTQ